MDGLRFGMYDVRCTMRDVIQDDQRRSRTVGFAIDDLRFAMWPKTVEDGRCRSKTVEFAIRDLGIWRPARGFDEWLFGFRRGEMDGW